MSNYNQDWPLQTGYASLDRLAGGLHPGEVVIIKGNLAAEFVLSLVDRIGVRSERGVLLCSGRSPKEQISERLMCCHAGIDSAMLSREELDESAWAAIRESASDLRDSLVLVEDVRDLSWPALRAKCQQVHSEFGIKLLALDLLPVAGTSRGSDLEATDGPAADPVGRLKGLAEELGIPVIIYGAASVDGVEQRAGLLLRVHSEDDSDKHVRTVECVLEKQDGVIVGRFGLAFRAKSMRFEK